MCITEHYIDIFELLESCLNATNQLSIVLTIYSLADFYLRLLFFIN